MSQVIRISNELYKRLEAHAFGFDTPSNVIETILNAYEGVPEESISPPDDMEPASNLEINYLAGSEEDFKGQLLSLKIGYIKLFYTDNSTKIKTWNATRLSPTSSVEGNLRTGCLRNWKEKGIYKAELSVSENDFS